jgi:hypothetical protein
MDEIQIKNFLTNITEKYLSAMGNQSMRTLYLKPAESTSLVMYFIRCDVT